MAMIVVLGAGLAGTLMAYELAPKLRGKDKLIVVGEGPAYHFVPSNPWVAVGWRTQKQIEVDLTKVMRRRRIVYRPEGAARVHPEENRLELRDGTNIAYDYLIVATGPDLAFDEIPGFGPAGHTQSVCNVSHALQARSAFEEFCKNPGPVIVGAAQGASCFGPAYEFAFILDTELRRRKIRDKVPMTFVTSEPYIGHLGLDGVGNTNGLLEGRLRDHHIKWLTNARVKSVAPGTMTVETVAEGGAVEKTHDVPYKFAMMLPAFRGVPALAGIAGLTNPRGFVLVDRQQRNPTFRNIFGIGVCIAIPPAGPTPVPVGVPKTGFMIESMVTAVARNLARQLRGKEPDTEATWNAICLADFGDGGVAFVAEPQLPPRNVNWSSEGRWVHLAKIAFEIYFLRKIRSGAPEPFYERWALEALGFKKLRRLA